MLPLRLMGQACTCLSSYLSLDLALTLPGCVFQWLSLAGSRLRVASGRRGQQKKPEVNLCPPPLSPFCPLGLLPFCHFPLSLSSSSASRQNFLTLPSVTQILSSTVLFLFFTASNISFIKLLRFHFFTIFISDHLCLHLATLLILLSHLSFHESQQIYWEHQEAS